MKEKSVRLIDRDNYLHHIGANQIDQVVGVIGVGEILTSLKESIPQTGICPNCNYTIQKYNETGLFGCALCYSSLYQKS